MSGDEADSFFKAPLPASRRWSMLLQSVSAQAALLVAGNVLVTRLAALSACWLLGKYEAFAAEQKQRRKREQEAARGGGGGGSSGPAAAADPERWRGRRERGQGLSARLSASALRLLDPPTSAGPHRRSDIDMDPERDEEGDEEGAAASDADADDNNGAEASGPATTAPAAAATASEPSAAASGHSHHRHHVKRKIRGYSSADVLARMNQLDTYVLLTTPNVFLFAALARGLGGDSSGSVAGVLPIADFMLFWALLFFFAAPALEQLLIVKGFMSRAIVNAHATTVSDGQLRALWEIATTASAARRASSSGGGAGGVSGGGGGDNGCSSSGRTWNNGGLARADTAAMTALVRHVRHLNTQESLAPRHSETTEELDRFTAGELRRAIISGGSSGGSGGVGSSGSGVGGGGGGGDEQGLLNFESFRRFFRSTGGMINLNRDPSRG